MSKTEPQKNTELYKHKMNSKTDNKERPEPGGSVGCNACKTGLKYIM